MEGATGDAEERPACVEQTAAGERTTVQDREAALTLAVAEGQWQRTVVLMQHGVTSPHRDTTLLRAAESDQWDCVLDVLCLGVSPEARAAVLHKAAKCKRWDCVSKILHLGVSRPVRGEIFLRAAHDFQWDCVVSIFDMGVTKEERDLVFPGVVNGANVRLSSDLITAGVGPQLREAVLQQAITEGRVSFLVELLRLTPDKALVVPFVLDTAVSLREWALVLEVVKLHQELNLTRKQMNAACRSAVTAGQWDCVLVLLEALVEHGATPSQSAFTLSQRTFTPSQSTFTPSQRTFTSSQSAFTPSQSTVRAVMRSENPDVLERFLGIFRRETMSSAIRKVLIDGAIGLGQGQAMGSSSGDILQEVLRRYGARDFEMELALGYACAYYRNGEALNVLVGFSGRNRQLLKQLCRASDRPPSPQIDVPWICHVLKGRNIVLSLDIARERPWHIHDFEAILLCKGTSRKVRCMFLQKLCKENRVLFKSIAGRLVDIYPQYRRTLFLMAVRQGCCSVALQLYGHGVSIRDMMFALSFSIAHLAPGKNSKDIVNDFVRTMHREDRPKLMKGLVRKSLDYFAFTGKLEAEFLAWFKLYCWTYSFKQAETGFVISIFRRAYKTAVKWDSVNCFIETESISLVVECKTKEQSSVTQTAARKVSKKDKSEADAAIDFALKKRKFGFVSQWILAKQYSELNACVLKRLFREGVWPVFHKLFESNDFDSGAVTAKSAAMCVYGLEFTHCLSRTVDNDAELGTSTDGASESEPDTLTVRTSESDTPTAWASDSLTLGATTTVIVGDSDTATAGGSDTLTVGALQTQTAGASDTVTVGLGASDNMTVGTPETPIVVATDTATVASTDTMNEGAVRALDKWLLCMCPSGDSRWNAGWVLTQSLGISFNVWVLSKPSEAVLRLAEFSTHHGCHGLALFLTAIMGAEGKELMERVVASPHLQSVGLNLLFEIACYACQNLRYNSVAAVLIKNLPLNVLSSGHSYMGSYMLRFINHEMISAFRRENALSWVLVSQVVGADLDEAEKTLTSCDPQDSAACVDVIVQYAIRWYRWDLIGKYVSEACQPGLLQQLSQIVLDSYECMDTGLAQRLVDLAGTTPNASTTSARPSPSLTYVIWHLLPRSRERALGLARCLVSLGQSAQQRRLEVEEDTGNCLLKRVSGCRELELVKLFHRSGLCSNRRLFLMAEASHHGSDFWCVDGGARSDVDKEAIQSYLTFAATCPPSLQDLCRHSVSSSLGGGGRPGYLQRVRALPAPAPVKEFLLFSDLTQ